MPSSDSLQPCRPHGGPPAPICSHCGTRRLSHRGITQDGRRRWRSSQLHVDHIVPTSVGGSKDDPGNLQIICANCHAYKSAVEDPALRRTWTQLSLPLASGPEQAAMF